MFKRCEKLFHWLGVAQQELAEHNIYLDLDYIQDEYSDIKQCWELVLGVSIGSERFNVREYSDRLVYSFRELATLEPERIVEDVRELMEKVNERRHKSVC